jgi:hypothetical protein
VLVGILLVFADQPEHIFSPTFESLTPSLSVVAAVASGDANNRVKARRPLMSHCVSHFSLSIEGDSDGTYGGASAGAGDGDYGKLGRLRPPTGTW